MTLSKAALHLLFALNLLTIGFLAVEARSRPGTVHGDACSDFPECAALVARADATLDEQLALKHAPIVYLPQLDRPCLPGGSAFAPIPVDAVLDNPEVRLRSLNGGSRSPEAPTGRDLYLAGNRNYFESYLDFPGNPTRAGCRYERDGLRFAADLPSLAYARIVRDESIEGLVLQYWLFYYFNDWNNKHEGDWELIQLHFDTPSVPQALADGPASIGLSQHRSGEISDWQDAKVGREGDRPVVYVARGSHANYFSPGLYMGRGEAGRGLGCDDAGASNRRTPLSAELLPAEIRGPADPYAWLAFKGYWGEVREGSTEGSTAPMTKQNWLHPLTWQERLKSFSVNLPTRGLIGPDPARAFCDVVAFGSEFVLPLYQDRPLFAVFAASALSLGLAGTLATTRFLPLRRLPLRSRRRLGQVLTAALDVYLANAYVFLTIALSSFPLGVLLASSQSFSPDLSPALNLTPLSLAGPGRTAIAIAMGGLHILLSGVLVVTATTVVLARLPGAQGPRPPFSWRDLAGVVLRRCLALALTVALCLTVIGIPLAIKQTLRWAFLEQATLIEGKTGRNAFSASSSLVAGHSGWVAAALALLALIALVGAPAMGIVLIMTLKSMPTAYVSLVTASAYAVVIPYVAIALSLVYFDLRERATPSAGY